jgi:hypothetical protein
VPEDRSTFELRVDFAPPVKQTAANAAERASQAALVQATREAFFAKHPDGWPMYPSHVDLQLVVRYERGRRRSDGANVIGGIADQLERLGVYHSDLQLRRIDYEEHPSADGRDRYTASVRPLGDG